MPIMINLTIRKKINPNLSKHDFEPGVAGALNAVTPIVIRRVP